MGFLCSAARCTHRPRRGTWLHQQTVVPGSLICVEGKPAALALLEEARLTQAEPHGPRAP